MLKNKIAQYGRKIRELHLEPVDYFLLERLIPQDEETILVVENLFGFRPVGGIIISTSGLVMITSLAFSYVQGYSASTISIFATLIGYFIVTGSGVFLSQKTLKKIDEVILLFFELIIERVKYNLKYVLCISEKSSLSFKWIYCLLPVLFLFSLGPLFGSVTQLFGVDNHYLMKSLVKFSTKYSDQLTLILKEHFVMTLSSIVMIALAMGMPYAMEKSFLNEAHFLKVRRRFLLINIWLIFCYLLTVLVPIYWSIESFTIPNAISAFRKYPHYEILFIEGFVLVQAVVGTYVHQQMSYKLWQGKSAGIETAFLYLIAIPCIFIIFVPLYLIPIALFSLVIIVFHWFFKICLQFERFPSPTKVIAFSCGLVGIIMKLYLSN